MIKRNTKRFQSTLPVGGATYRPWIWCCSRFPFQSTLPVGGATVSLGVSTTIPTISIHAPRGGATAARADFDNTSLISIHAPRGGSDKQEQRRGVDPGHFNPRSPWGERPGALVYLRLSGLHFNPRSPWGERPGPVFPGCRHGRISIHAPRGGSDFVVQPCWQAQKNFNPRSPWGERPSALRSETALLYFNPRSPWGERLVRMWMSLLLSTFQSTLPVGGATEINAIIINKSNISIHAPRGGSDLQPEPILITPA